MMNLPGLSRQGEWRVDQIYGGGGLEGGRPHKTATELSQKSQWLCSSAGHWMAQSWIST
jgi:hypothetical protein